MLYAHYVAYIRLNVMLQLGSQAAPFLSLFTDIWLMCDPPIARVEG